jgi:(4-O-methyl)-D-glucuronate---lignin esterase
LSDIAGFDFKPQPDFTFLRGIIMRHWNNYFSGFLSFFLSLTVALLLMNQSTMADEKPLPSFEELPVQKNLPDPFTMMDGSKVTTREQWYQERRPELKKLFQHYMYGYFPESPGINSKVMSTDTLWDGKATLTQVDIHINGLKGEKVPVIHLAIFLPTNHSKQVPVFIGLNKCGNHAVVDSTKVHEYKSLWPDPICENKPGSKRGSLKVAWTVKYLIERGYGFAAYCPGHVDPDHHDFTDGIHPYFKDQEKSPETAWGTIAAWAWGAMRCVDYLETVNEINPKQIAIIGHSRRGKTALLAGAMDERFALVVPHQSGTGGCALSRNNDEETVERINRVFPHWFSDMFTKFNDQENKLPIDQHLLISLVAPRPLMETSGLQDTWANYKSSIKGLRVAGKIYEFLGAPGLKGTGIVQNDEKTDSDEVGNLLQYRRDVKHVLNQEYWVKILDFADKQFGRK